MGFGDFFKRSGKSSATPNGHSAEASKLSPETLADQRNWQPKRSAQNNPLKKLPRELLNRVRLVEETVDGHNTVFLIAKDGKQLTDGELDVLKDTLNEKKWSDKSDGKGYRAEDATYQGMSALKMPPAPSLSDDLKAACPPPPAQAAGR